MARKKILPILCMLYFIASKSVTAVAQDSSAFPMGAKAKFYADIGFGYTNKGLAGYAGINYITNKWGVGIGMKAGGKKAKEPDDYMSGFTLFGSSNIPSNSFQVFSLYANRLVQMGKKSLAVLRAGPSYGIDHIYTFEKRNSGFLTLGSNYTTTENVKNGFGLFTEAKFMVPFKHVAFECLLFNDLNGNRNIAGLLIGFSVY